MNSEETREATLAMIRSAMDGGCPFPVSMHVSEDGLYVVLQTATVTGVRKWAAALWLREPESIVYQREDHTWRRLTRTGPAVFAGVCWSVSSYQSVSEQEAGL
ncbi:hypothetical protein [Longispora albida]|uniref:hypothetical protein n=1 Tax=Longispora albida TaxID=203523 RepID=UPI0003717303|nr:hypothetical protein [Longispora albida]